MRSLRRYSLLASLALSFSHASWQNEFVSVSAGRTTTVTYGNNAGVLCKRMLGKSRPNTVLDMKLGVGRYTHNFFHQVDHRLGSDMAWKEQKQGLVDRRAGVDSAISVSSFRHLPEIDDISKASMKSLADLYSTIYPRSLVDSIIAEEERVLLASNTAFLALSLPKQSPTEQTKYVSFIRHYDFSKGSESKTEAVKEHGLKGSPAPAEVALKLRGVESKVFKAYRKRRTLVEFAKDVWHAPLDAEPKRIVTSDPHQVAWDPPIIPRGYKAKEVGRTFVDPTLKNTDNGKLQYKEARRLQELWQEEVIDDDTYYIGHCSLASNEGFELTLSWGFGVLEKINVNKDPLGPPQWEYLMMVKGSDFKKALEAKRLSYESRSQ